MPLLREIAHVTLSAKAKEALEETRRLETIAPRKAPPKLWRKTQDGAPDSYVGRPAPMDDAPDLSCGDIAFHNAVTGEVVHVNHEGVNEPAHRQPPLPQSRSFDGETGPDAKLPNGVRQAWMDEHRNGFQHGRLRVYGGNLVLMPSPEAVVASKATSPIDLSDARLDAELLKAQRTLEALQRRLAYSKEHVKK